ncbi:hypothetical protein CYMTET_55260 [Cymbomonas tetramitiformis]|uniref:Uncharacterized protein n=1 Tax=Cymbomonas tetramitiformis TaxID=36881 RepID=A0AAE0EMZ6_9CHLO|nr:hypothetical protein CYMTET_55260 [Cymbomonas tetramitiformis]
MCAHKVNLGNILSVVRTDHNTSFSSESVAATSATAPRERENKHTEESEASTSASSLSSWIFETAPRGARRWQYAQAVNALTSYNECTASESAYIQRVQCHVEPVPLNIRIEVLQSILGDVAPTRNSRCSAFLGFGRLSGHKSQEHPLSSVAECGDQACGTNRLVNPEARRGFQHMILAATKSVFRLKSSKTQRICYVSAGAGLLYMDVLLLARLQQQKLEVGRVVLIDKLYEEPPGTAATRSAPSVPDAAHRNFDGVGQDYDVGVQMHKEALQQLVSFFPEMEVWQCSSLQAYRRACEHDPSVFRADLFIQCDFTQDTNMQLMRGTLNESGLGCRLFNLCDGNAGDVLPAGEHAQTQMEYATYGDVHQLVVTKSGQKNLGTLVRLISESTKPLHY